MISSDQAIERAALSFRGERFLPEVGREMDLEHRHRYLIARDVAKDLRVLDIGCRDGHGSAMLAQTAAHVVGVDVAEEAITRACAAYPKANLVFLVGAADRIPLRDHSADLVVGFQTLEHHDRYDDILREIKRVLQPGGTLMMSFPGTVAYSNLQQNANESQADRLHDHEFRELIGRYFKRCRIYGQRIVDGSSISCVDLTHTTQGHRIEHEHLVESRGAPRPVGLIAAASDGDPLAPASGILDQPITDADLFHFWSQRVAALEARIAAQDTQMSDQTAAGRAQVEALLTTVALRDAQLADMQLAWEHCDGQRIALACQLHAGQYGSARRFAGTLRALVRWSPFAARALQTPPCLGRGLLGLKFSRHSRRQDARLLAVGERFDEQCPLPRSMNVIIADVRPSDDPPPVGSRQGSEPGTLFDTGACPTPQPQVATGDSGPPTHRRDRDHSAAGPALTRGSPPVGATPSSPALPGPLRRIWRTFPISNDNRLRIKRTVLRLSGRGVGDGFTAAAYASSDQEPEDFDAEFYLRAYPDVAAAGVDAFVHYSTNGIREGRLGCAPVPSIHGDVSRLNPERPTVLVVSHEASRTGAPILALNIAQHLRANHNVIGLLLGGGGLITDFHQHCDVVIGPCEHSHNPVIIGVVVADIAQRIKLKFAIVSSIESRAVLEGLARAFVPTLSLIHEFAAYTRPRQAISEVALWASELVFSATIVRASAQQECPVLGERPAIILPQGRSAAPQPARSRLEQEQELERIRRTLRPDSLPESTVVILGAGAVHLRKGVDLFLACAARVASLQPKYPFRFVWVGHGFDPDRDVAYSVYLQDQLSRAGLEGLVVFAGEFDNIDLAYEMSDALLLSSRLDPFPNVAIDAAHHRLPIVCFDRTTGIADVLRENGLADPCVVPYLDIEAAAQRLRDLIDSPQLRNQIGQQLEALGARLFDMATYAESLIALALQVGRDQDIEREDCAIIAGAEVFRNDFFATPGPVAPPVQDAVRTFVRSWASGVDLRKPFPGFHPGIYRDEHGIAVPHRNPLADFINVGRPVGPWLREVITPGPGTASAAQPLRAALHIHAYYPELVPRILSRLADQALELDLLVSAPTAAAAAELSSLLAQFPGTVEVRIVPNRGRDIAPLLTEFGAMIQDRYDVIGHVHTKKSLVLGDTRFVERWLDFLLENLLGGKHAMATNILGHLAADETLGLVFPDDPHVVGWNNNLQLAQTWARRLGIDQLPQRHLWFPVGTMFWARTAALAPLLDLGLRWEDYPEEPVPYDGTALHALERLLPSVIQKTGYRFALTNVSGVTR